MRAVKTTAMVVAILAGAFALIAYTAAVRGQGGANAALGYVWLLFTAAFAIVAAALVLSRPDADVSWDQAHTLAGREQDDWSFCPNCGVRLPHTPGEAAYCGAQGERADDDWDDYDPKTRTAGNSLLWLGVFALDVLFVLLVLWLFVPQLAVSHKLFSSLGGSLTPGILVMDIGISCVLVGYSVAKWG